MGLQLPTQWWAAQRDMTSPMHSPTQPHYLTTVILVAPCWIKAPWLPTVLNMLEDASHQCPIMKDLIMDISVCCMLKGLPFLHLTLWLLRDVCGIDKSSLPQSVRQWQGQLKHLQPKSTSSVGKNRWVYVLKRVYQTVHSVPNLADCLVNLFRVDWFGIPLTFIALLYQLFWNHIIIKLYTTLSSLN